MWSNSRCLIVVFCSLKRFNEQKEYYEYIFFFFLVFLIQKSSKNWQVSSGLEMVQVYPRNRHGVLPLRNEWLDLMLIGILKVKIIHHWQSQSWLASTEAFSIKSSICIYYIYILYNILLSYIYFFRKIIRKVWLKLNFEFLWKMWFSII